jgi:hypothetical protein
MNVHVRSFPSGEGPPIMLQISDMTWPRLGPGQEALVGGENGHVGALAFGLGEGLAIIWAFLMPRRPFVALCYHAGSKVTIPFMHQRALQRLGVRPRDFQHLYVVLASQRDIDEAEAKFFLDRGIRSDRVILYSASLLAQFGVSASGCVGEAG